MGRIPERGKPRENVFTMRFTAEERAQMLEQRAARGYQSDAPYIRRLLSDDAKRIAEKRAQK